jgi:uncharacterized protein YneF (UPF0154 family)
VSRYHRGSLSKTRGKVDQEAKVRRKEILGITVMVIAVFLISVIVMGTIVIWLPLFLIRPNLALSRPIQEAIVRQMTHQMVKGVPRAYVG